KTDSVDFERLKNSSDPIVKLVDRIIKEAINRKSSDIHIESYEKEMIVKYRIDGVLYEYERLDRGKQEYIISRLKIMSGLNITENRIPQDGRFKTTHNGENINFRISVLPTIFGETAVIRILSSYQFDVDIDEIGMSTANRDRFKYALQKIGMILVSGPTGSGKTTTLYSALKTLTGSGLKIVTIEDPVEYDIEGVVQIAVNNKVGLTFSEGLRSIVRQDPNVIMVGEIRDMETAKIAVNSALTGHLVLSTVHANNAFDTFARLNNLGCENYLLASAIEIIISQRLVRKLCPICKKEFPIDQNYTDRYIRLFKIPPKTTSVFRSMGCSKCYFTGYSGRQGVFELLDLDDKASLYLNESTSIRELKEVFEKMDFTDLKSNGSILIQNGITTLKEFERSI
ncbi:type II/IV secretion system protein, partial [bacterium]|nr:type II/IV secretion system protein [bacterium]